MDKRAPWCSINWLHGPHGAQPQTPCGGFAHENSREGKMGISRTLVSSAVHSLNDKAEQLGMARRFEFAPGSRTLGRQHALLELQPPLAHPVAETKIGKTLKEALDYVTAMNHGLLAVLADRSHRRSNVATGEIPVTRFDPDARSVTRSGQ